MMKNALIIAAFALFLFLTLRQCKPSKEVAENHAENVGFQKQIDVLYKGMDSLKATDRKLNGKVDIALENSIEAKEEVAKSQNDLYKVKRENERSLQNIKQKSDEIIKRLNEAPDVVAVDRIFDSIEKSRAKMFPNQ